MKIASGNKVKISLTTKDKNGRILEEILENDPITMSAGIRGKSEISTRLSKSLVGMRRGESKTIRIESSKGKSFSHQYNPEEDVLLTFKILGFHR